ncbi:MAG TPA: hypothetical protein VJ783_31175 [Pirellulales bacterium]|nr:hypothetical protein [Pirellulales bacterium]
MVIRRRRSPLVALGVVLVFSQAGAWAKVAERWNDLSLDPRVIRYDAENDKFTRQDSVFKIISKNKRPGGKHSYSGSRLNQFQFHGKPGRGGIYDALDAHKRHLDPRNYEYRRR